MLLFLLSPAQAGVWTQLGTAGDIPSGRTTPAVAAVDGQVYLWSGVRDDFATFENTFYDDLYRFDPLTSTWTELHPVGDKPSPRTFAASTGDEERGQMLVFGGSVYDPTFQTFEVYDDLWAYSPSCGSWSQLGSGAGPSARSGATMWVEDDVVYVFGGVTQFFEFKSDLWAYDFATDSWTELIADGLATSPPGRHVAASGARTPHGELTLYGGEALDFSTFEFLILPDVWQLDLDTLVWTEVTPAPAEDLPQHRNYSATEIIGQQLFAQGGDIPGGSDGCGAPFAQNVTDELWSFHLVQHRWTQLHPTGDPLPRLKRSRAAVVGDVMYVFSGWDFQCDGGVGPGQVFNTDVFTYTN
jgi:N-acetylneuraminic acid mutarotase